MPDEPAWVLQHKQNKDTDPVIAVALHSGHAISSYLTDFLAISEADRLREEDPYTDIWARTAESWITIERSRFDVDLNRPREKAIYRTPADAWGLQVWKHPLPSELVARSLYFYDAFYAQVHEFFTEIEACFGSFVVLDLHSYCHRRGGPDAPPAPQVANPDVNVGTGTMPDRKRWAPVIEQCMNTLRAVEIDGRPLDVRENIKFQGGSFARWMHTTFPRTACVLSIEFKKFFMDEWTGLPNTKQIDAIRTALKAMLPDIRDVLSCVTP